MVEEILKVFEMAEAAELPGVTAGDYQLHHLPQLRMIPECPQIREKVHDLGFLYDGVPVLIAELSERVMQLHPAVLFPF